MSSTKPSPASESSLAEAARSWPDQTAPRLSGEQAAAIEGVRAVAAPTRRAVVPALEDILYEPLPVLDRGFIRVIDYMGDDAAIVQAARVSYGQGTRQVSDDRGLIRYLMRQRHTSPFEMCELKLHVKLPIFVARQWIRHRTANVNEYSARYSVLHDEFYVPDRTHLAAQSQTNRQGRAELVEDAEASAVQAAIGSHSERAYDLYLELLNQDRSGEPQAAERRGLARELARMVLPLNTYTEWYWKLDLHNLLHFTALRADAHAQYEIRAYAECLEGVLQRWLPLTYDAYLDYRRDGASLSAAALAVVRRRLRGERVSQADSGLSPREWRELEALLADG